MNSPLIEYSAQGYITFWNLTEGSHELYEKHFFQLGYDDFCPKPQTSRTALYAATKNLLNGSYVLTQDMKEHAVMKPRKKGGNWETCPTYDVYAESAAPTINEAINNPPVLTPAFTTSVRKDEPPELTYHRSLIYGSSPPAGTIQHLKSTYERERNTCTPSAVSKSLKDILKAFNATSLRARGGIYWIPTRVFDSWKIVADTVHKCSRHHAHKRTPQVYILTVTQDLDLLNAVKEGLTKQISNELKDLVSDAQSKNLGERALQARQGQAIDIKKRLQEYEGVLGETLDNLHEACDMAKSVAAEALLNNL